MCKYCTYVQLCPLLAKCMYNGDVFICYHLASSSCCCLFFIVQLEFLPRKLTYLNTVTEKICVLSGQHIALSRRKNTLVHISKCVRQTELL